MVNPLAGADHQIAGWFHAHLSQAFVNLLRVFSEPGSAQLIGVVLFLPEGAYPRLKRALARPTSGER